MISIIIPVYNTIQYLENCISSVITQSFKNWELILVDDGSTDGSGEICDIWASKDSRIRVFHKENGGVSSARCLGVQISKGEWITFVDSDDVLPENSLDILFNEASDEYDMVIGSLSHQPYENKILSVEEFRSEVIKEKYPSVCSKLIRSGCFKALHMELPTEIKYGEDSLMTLKLSFSIKKKVRVLNTITYVYNQNQGSCTHTFYPSYEYQSKLCQAKVEAIPSNLKSRYFDDIFELIYGKWKDYCGYNIELPLNYKDSFIKDFLIENIKEGEISPLDKILIRSKIVIVRFIIIGLKKILNHM